MAQSPSVFLVLIVACLAAGSGVTMTFRVAIFGFYILGFQEIPILKKGGDVLWLAKSCRGHGYRRWGTSEHFWVGQWCVSLYILLAAWDGGRWRQCHQRKCKTWFGLEQGKIAERQWKSRTHDTLQPIYAVRHRSWRMKETSFWEWSKIYIFFSI